jgi:hypothetical protein
VRLYSYCLPFDDGAAPNPRHGVCTLVICKPRIRSTAQVGDWIVGTGAKHARRADGSTQDMSGRLIYAMRVSQRMSMDAYDKYTREHLPRKIPGHAFDRGDSIYDFSGATVVQRPGPHTQGNVETDLSGKNALLSDHFFYFGDAAIALPPNLLPIAQNRQGHRVRLNEPYAETFVSWLEGLGYPPCSEVGKPLMTTADERCRQWCASCRADDDELDVEVLVQPNKPC